MRAYILRTDTRIEPFGDPARDLPVGDVPLSKWQADLFDRFGLEVVPVGSEDEIPTDEDRIIVRDNVFFTRRVLKSFLGRWKAAGRPPSRLALPAGSTFVRSFSALQDIELAGAHALYDFWGLPRGTPATAKDSAAPLEVLYEEKLLRMPVPEQVTGLSEWAHPITSSVCLHVRHWVHVLQANRLAIQVRWVDEVVRRPLWGAWLLLRALLPGRGRFHWRLLGAANRFGRDVDIHPTARVEGSFIGDGVRIGAQALVRASIIGAGSVIEDRANVAYSVIGPNNFVSKYTLVYTSASFDGANIGMSMQMCLVGKKAALTPRATPLDVLPGRKIKVKDGAELKEVDLPVLGSCYGHECFIGADVYIAPGREIPNGVQVVPRPDRVLGALPEEVDPTRMYTVRNGRLEEV